MNATIYTELNALAEEVAALRIDGLPSSVAAARLVWSHIIEPGDVEAASLIRTAGAEAALAVLIDPPAKQGIVITTLSTRELNDAILRWKPKLKLDAVRTSLRLAARLGVHLIIRDDPEWPSQLDELPAPPVALWARGNASLLTTRSVALVGARAATGYGEHVSMELASGLVDRGITVISGGAYGIDGMSHRAALSAKGNTIAVLAGGLDRYYPSGHEALLTRIAESGLVISELPPGQSPTKWRFLQRNRVIAAIAEALVVVEAGWRSGSLNAAGHAHGLGRPLGAVPGPITSAASAGCHRLLRDFSATCITDASEIMELIGETPREDADKLGDSELAGEQS